MLDFWLPLCMTKTALDKAAVINKTNIGYENHVWE
jgi:hypothetical protein